MKKILLVFSLLLFMASVAQQNESVTTEGPALQTASVIVHKDPRIDVLVKKKAAINKNAKKSVARTGRGYRLLVLSTSDREEAIAAKTKIYTYFPELKAYLSYQSPFFKLKAGNFVSRPDAERYRKNMATIFPKGVFIINDIVEIKLEKEKEED